MRKYIQAKIRSSGCLSVFSSSLHQSIDPPVSFLWSISGLLRKRQMVPTPYARRGRRGITLAISMRRNLSYRGGAQEEQGQLRQAHSRVVLDRCSYSVTPYSLLPHQYELNLSSTSNSFLVLLYLLGGRLGVVSITPLRRTMELAAGRNLEMLFSPQSSVSSPPLLLRDHICDSTEYVYTDQHLGLFTHLNKEPLCLHYGPIWPYNCCITQMCAISSE